ncbi:MAG: low-specificity L-threonine aldolase [Bacillota bacterium]
MPEVKIIDFRSDTVTRPTQEMREAMYRAEVGDDVYGDDPTVNKLEEIAALKVGKEAAVFVPTGTMGNQTAVMAWTSRGDEIILEEQAHIYMYEVGGPAVLSGVQMRTIRGRLGAMDPAEVKAAIRAKNIHFPRTSLVCIENTHNRSGGCIVPLENMKAIYEVAHDGGANVHLDGARVFNAAIGLGVDVKEITRYADSVQFCLSKGLCSPIGSIVAGPKDFIERVRKCRKLLGGGMRQAGIVAAAGIISLTKMVDRLAEDHANAKLLAEGLNRIPGLKVDMETVQTNMVAVHTRELGMDGPVFQQLMRSRGVWFNADLPYRVRMVTHNDVTRADVEEALVRITEAVKNRP